MENSNPTPSPRRLSWPELRRYWETHAEEDGQLDLQRDPESLGNVAWPGQPLWLNEHIVSLQVPVYAKLLGRVPHVDGSTALDVGCGSGRWVRVLSQEGFSVTGLDLQEALLAVDRKRYPEATFYQGALQEFASNERFDLVSSVCVLQHNPEEQHPELIDRLRRLVVRGGHALVLENVHDQASHVFARSVRGWQDLFSASGFRAVAVAPYDYSPVLRLAMNARRLAPSARARHVAGTDRGPGEVRPSGFEGTLRDGVLRAAAAIDTPLERMLTARGPVRGSVHCGFLFEAV